MNITNILYESMAEVKEPKPKDVLTFSPSSLSNCKRAIYWKAKGEKPSNPPDNASLFKMKMGDIIHDWVQQRLTELGILESFEEARTAEFNGLTFNYFYDGILNINDQRAILEIKTVYSNGFKTVENEPKPEHILQCLSYMLFEGIDNGVILYIGRDNGYMIDYTLRLSVGENPNAPDVILLIDEKPTNYYAQWLNKIEEMKALKQKFLLDELPERDYSITLKNNKGVIVDEFQKDSVKYRSDWQCSYCPFKDKCWQNEYKEIQSKSFFINGKFI